MKFLRFATYGLLLSAIVFLMQKPQRVIPARLAPPSYATQALSEVRGHMLNQAGENTRLQVSGGIPAQSVWVYREGPDFDIWHASWGKDPNRVQVGVYFGSAPNCSPPSEGLVKGGVGGIPVLWWRHQSEDYVQMWECVVPTNTDRIPFYLHIGIRSFSATMAAQAAADLASVHFSFAPYEAHSLNKTIEVTPTAVPAAANAPAEPSVGAPHH